MRPWLTARVAATLLGMVALSACARPTTDAQQDTQMTQEDDSAETAIVEAMKAADKVHEANARKHPPRIKVERVTTNAPSIAVSELRARIVRLVGSLRTPADTQATHVGNVLGVDFAPQMLAVHEGEAAGALSEGWPYSIGVYKSAKGAIGKQVRINMLVAGSVDPRNSAKRVEVCAFDFKPFADELTVAGYKGNDTTLPFMEQWTFTRSLEKERITFFVSAELYRADDGTPAGRQCVVAVVIAVEPSGVGA